MMQITLKNDSTVLYKGEGLGLSPLGFYVSIPKDNARLFSDHSGRFIQFNVELNLSSRISPDLIFALCKVVSIRRVSQDYCDLDIRFTDMQPDGYHRIAVFLRDNLQSLISPSEQLAG